MRKTLLLLLLTAVFCGAFARKTPQVAPAPQVPDSLRGFYLFTEGIKQAFIERDTAAARASLERSVEADSTYGPAWYELAELLLYNDAPAALRHAERAFRTDTTDKWYLLQLGQAQILNDRYRDAIRTYNRLRLHYPASRIWSDHPPLLQLQRHSPVRYLRYRLPGGLLLQLRKSYSLPTGQLR